MTDKEKQILIADLCARLPYGVKVSILGSDHMELKSVINSTIGWFAFINGSPIDFSIDEVKPYLRPMSSMTEEEKKEVSILLNYEFYIDDDCAVVAEDDRHRIRLDLMQVYIDWLNSNHFDYRGLIPIGLALEAPEEMYNIK